MGFARVGSNPTVVDNFFVCHSVAYSVRPCGAMDSASDFGSGGWGFESPQGLRELFFVVGFFVDSLLLLSFLRVASLQVWPSG